MLRLKLVGTALRESYYGWRYGAKGRGKQKVKRNRQDALKCWPLVSPYEGRGLNLAHRVVQAPVTRCRCVFDKHTVSPLVREYYKQRFTEGGLTIFEATSVSPVGELNKRVPSVYTDEQEEGFKLLVADANEVKAKLFVQLFHVGYASSKVAWSPSGISYPTAIPEGFSPTSFLKLPNKIAQAHIMTADDINQLKLEYTQAAQRLDRAGVHGVDVCLAAGGLLHTFIVACRNCRTDKYGGTPEKRARLALEIVEAVAGVVGPERVGVSLSFGYDGSGIVDSFDLDRPTYLYLTAQLSRMGICYVNYWPRWQSQTAPASNDFVQFHAHHQDFLKHVREKFNGTLIRSSFGCDFTAAAEMVANEQIDLAAFGVAFICAPDLVNRIRHGAPVSSSYQHMIRSNADFNRNFETTEAHDALHYIDWLPADLPDEPPQLIHMA
ncbi:12-oxophytodienoate reductase 1 [Diplonema papillatum]|nr:12-oxophytodienoate reductase 1 [Diplonema papillatum]